MIDGDESKTTSLIGGDESKATSVGVGGNLMTPDSDRKELLAKLLIIHSLVLVLVVFRAATLL